MGGYCLSSATDLHLCAAGTLVHVLGGGRATAGLLVRLPEVAVGVVAEPVAALPLHTLGDGLPGPVRHPWARRALLGHTAVVSVPRGGAAEPAGGGYM